MYNEGTKTDTENMNSVACHGTHNQKPSGTVRILPSFSIPLCHVEKQYRKY